MRILQPPGWPRPRGYANGIEAEGRFVFVAGQIGWDETGQVPERELRRQFRQALVNTLAVLAKRRPAPEHIARMTWFITSRDEYIAALAELGAAWKDLMGRNYPAMSVIIVSGLVEPEAKIEIETTAVVPHLTPASLVKIAVVGGGPGGLYFALLTQEGAARLADRRLRAEPGRRHVRLRRRVLGRDARRILEPRRPILCDDQRRRSPIGTTSSSTIKGARCAAAATALPAARGSRCCRFFSNAATSARRRRALRISRRRSSRALPIATSSSRRTASTAASARPTSNDFKPALELKANKFAWLGSTRPLDAFTFFFKETPHGLICAHTYQYEPGGSTWVMEMSPATLGGARLRSLGRRGERAAARDDLRRRARRPHARHQPLAVAQLPARVLRELVAQEHRAARRRQGDGAFFDRLGHQACDGMRDRACRTRSSRMASDRSKPRSALTTRRGAPRCRSPSTMPT